FHPAHDRARKQTLTDSARAPMPTLCSMRRVAAGEMMSFDHALKATAFGDADGINVIPWRKERRAQHVAWLHFFGEIAKLADAFDRHTAEFFDVAEHSLRKPMLFLVVKPQLHGIIP